MPKRVVYFHDSHDFGGMELYLYRLMRNLDPERYSPAVLVPGYTDQFRSSPRRVIEDVRDSGIPLIRPPDSGNVKIIHQFKEILGMAQLLRSHGTSIVHIHTCRPEGARKVTLSTRLAGIRGLIRTEHFPPSITMLPRSKLMIKPFDWMTDYIVTGSENDRKEQIQLLRRSAEKVVRAYNSIELYRFIPQEDTRLAKERLGLSADIPVLSSVGRLVQQKGHRYLVEAVGEVVRQYGAVNLLLVGDGILRSELEELCQELGIVSYVHFVGFQDDVLPYLQATDIAVMPSLFEVFSLAMLECMALGKPVIASDHPSFKEAITTGKDGLIVPMKNSHALAEAILKLLKDEQLRLEIGNSGRKRVVENFGIDRLANEMMDLYDHVLL